jgi:hypothetical protein
MGYFTYREDEAYREGRRDAEYGWSGYDHDRHAWDGPDKAYWDGRKEYEREEECRREYIEEERRAEEREHQRQQEKREYIRAMEEAEYERYNEQEYPEQEYLQPEYPSDDDLPF